MKILPNKFRDQADRHGNSQIGYKFSEKHMVRFWSLLGLGIKLFKLISKIMIIKVKL